MITWRQGGADLQGERSQLDLPPLFWTGLK